MARIINRDELNSDPLLLTELKKSVFVYPTDTIYGIGCDATNEKLVARLRQIKNSFNQPFSIIIPNKNLIQISCQVDAEAEKWLAKLPGPYTLILKVKNRFFADNVNNNSGTIGVRIPDNWFYEFIKKMKVSVVTTSANITGQDFMTSIDDLDDEIEKKVDFIVYDGPLKGRPSTIVNLSTNSADISTR